MGFSSVSDGTAIQGNRSPSLHKCQCIESWNSEIAVRKRNHTLQCGCFNESAQYSRSSFELVCAIPFDRRRTATRKNSLKSRICEQRNTTEREFTSSEPYGIFSKTRTWKQFAGNIQDFESLSETIQFTRVCEDALGYRLVRAARPNLTRTTVLDKSSQYAENTHFLELTHNPEHIEQFLVNNFWTIEVHIVEMLDNFGLEIAIPSPNNPRRTYNVLISRGKSRFVDELHIKCRTLQRQRGITL